MAGTIMEGERLRQQEIAARWGVSQTPVREAFRRLESKGAIQLVDAGVSTDPDILWFNLTPGAPAARDRPWLQEEALRHAISAAVNRQTIVNTVYLGAAVPIDREVILSDGASVELSARDTQEAGGRGAGAAALVGNAIEITVVTGPGGQVAGVRDAVGVAIADQGGPNRAVRKRAVMIASIIRGGEALSIIEAPISHEPWLGAVEPQVQ